MNRTYEQDLGARLWDLYTRAEFGKVSKSEIDTLVFHYALLGNLGRPFLEPAGRIRYFSIGKTEIRRLSLLLKMTESRVGSLIEKDFLLYGADEKVEEFLLALVNATTITSGLLKAGKIRFLVPNPVARTAIEERIAAVGGIPDASFNREVLVLEIYDFLKLVNLADDERIARILQDNLLAKARLTIDSDAKRFLDELNRVPVGERLKRLALGVLDKVLGKTGDELIALVFDLLKPKSGA